MVAFITPVPVCLTSSFTPSVSFRSSIHPNHITPTRVRVRPVRNETIRAAHDDRTFVAVKPDGMNRALLGSIISRFEAKGFTLVGIKTLVPTRELAETHYEALSKKPFFNDLVEFITSGPVCAMVWQGEGVVAAARKMIGETNPSSSPPGTIRGDFGIDVGRK